MIDLKCLRCLRLSQDILIPLATNSGLDVASTMIRITHVQNHEPCWVSSWLDCSFSS